VFVTNKHLSTQNTEKQHTKSILPIKQPLKRAPQAADLVAQHVTIFKALLACKKWPVFNPLNRYKKQSL
jgi:hypothetical protein